MQDQVNLEEEVKKIKKNIKARVEAKYGVYEGQGRNKTEKEQQLRTKAITRITERKNRVETKKKRREGSAETRQSKTERKNGKE